MNEIKHKSGLSELNRRICPQCGKYYPTLKALQSHRSVCENVVFTTDPEELEEETEQQQQDNDIEAEAAAAPTQRPNVFERINVLFGI